MLFKRQRVLLTLLDALEGTAKHTDFQKLLFLYSRECEDEPSYEFVPYRFGGFSFTSYADKRKLIARGFLVDDDQHWTLTDAGRKAARSQAVEPLRTVSFFRRYGHLRGHALVIEQYRRFPYYASRSEILDKLDLTSEEIDSIAAAKPPRQPAGLLTIGYEGRSLENYLNSLLRAGVTVLCDVRRNALSRKYGFSKGTLSNACSGVDIRYVHIPELGIASGDRRELKTQADYDLLFANYERTTLPHQTAALDSIRDWVSRGDRVALTCYEQYPRQCHRSCVANAIGRGSTLQQRVQHL